MRQYATQGDMKGGFEAIGDAVIVRSAERQVALEGPALQEGHFLI